jgi:serine/threonine-protein kinase RsbT
MSEEEKSENWFDIEGGNFRNAGQVSSGIKRILKEIGCSPDMVRRAAIVTYEAEINIVCYAKRGKIHLVAKPDYVAIDASDEGPGIADIDQAMQEGYSTASDEIREMGFGAGMGFANMERYANDFEITSVVNAGTRVRMNILRQGGE